jgi:hypothetical protein
MPRCRTPVGPGHDRAGAPGIPGGADRLGGEAGRAAGGVRAAAAQPGARDHRGGHRGADGGGQRVQPADQHRLALDLGVAERRALFLVAVDPALHRVDVHERELVRAGQQRRQPGQLREQLPADLLQLAGIPPGERAQERPQRGRGPDPAEQLWHGPVAQQVHVVNRAGARGHPGDQAADLDVRVHPSLRRDRDMAADQGLQPGLLGQGHDRGQPGPGHEIRVVEGCGNPQRVVRQSHLQGALLNWPARSFSHSHCPSSGGTFRFGAPGQSRIQTVD